MFFSRHFKITIFFVLPIIAAFIFGGVFEYKKQRAEAATTILSCTISGLLATIGGNFTDAPRVSSASLDTGANVITINGVVAGGACTGSLSGSSYVSGASIVAYLTSENDGQVVFTFPAAGGGSGACSGTDGCGGGGALNYTNDRNPTTGVGGVTSSFVSDGIEYLKPYIGGVEYHYDSLNKPVIVGREVQNIRFGEVGKNYALAIKPVGTMDWQVLPTQRLKNDLIGELPESLLVGMNYDVTIVFGLDTLDLSKSRYADVYALYVVPIDNIAPEINIKSKDIIGNDITGKYVGVPFYFAVTDDSSRIANLLFTVSDEDYGITTGPMVSDEDYGITTGPEICPPGTKLAQVGNGLASTESNVTMSPKVTGVKLDGVRGLLGEDPLNNNPLGGKPNNKLSSSGVTGENRGGVRGLLVEDPLNNNPLGRKPNNKPSLSGVTGVNLGGVRGLEHPILAFSKHSPLGFYMDLLDRHATLRVYDDTGSYVPYDKLYKTKIGDKTHIQLGDSGLVYAVAMGPGGEPISIPNTEEGNFVLLVIDSVTGEKIAEIRVSLKDGKLMSVAGDFIPDSAQFSANDNVLHVYAEDAAGNKSSESLSLSPEEELEIVIEEESDPFKISLKRVDAPFAVSLRSVDAPFGVSLKRTSEPPPFTVDIFEQIYEDVPIISISDLFDFSVGDNLDSDFGNLEISIREVFDPKNIPTETPADIKILRNTSSESGISPKISTPSRAGAPVRSDDSSVIDREVIIKGPDESDLDNLEFYIRESYNEPKNDDEPIAIEVKKDDARNNEIAISDNKFLSQQSSASLYSAIVNWLFPKQKYPAGHNTDISAGWADYEGNWSTWPMDHSVNYSASWVGVPRGKTAAWPSDHHVAASNLGNFK